MNAIQGLLVNSMPEWCHVGIGHQRHNGTGGGMIHRYANKTNHYRFVMARSAGAVQGGAD
ncbi:hypothetical protein [Sphingomonas abaci]|uniref:Uncharacterized protein n=1 Tax=Sphingomonas abaci TaxID=237611 RepID=A0A7W7EWJ5_9SPHN|nr:hypothetical protein [Sphingomonas abaci]MBB4616607.1 hypothetical protein [Sphingomonas abaci]